ncbi:hypothetical protein ACHQM5_024119 [Ranunculus cassubicifolius]
MMWNEWINQFDDDEDEEYQQQEEENIHFSLLSNPKDYYKILEVDYDATEDTIRSNYIRLALKWHPDKRKDEDSSTSVFQDINEAYTVLSDPAKRREYDRKGMLYIYDSNIDDYLNSHMSLILTCNGLGIKHSIW